MPNTHRPLILITGSSGVGKNAVIDELMRRSPKLTQVISVTTRWPARSQEKFAQNYFFVDHERFEWLNASGQLLESTHVYGDYYGTLTISIEEALSSGKIPILAVDQKGIENYRLLGYNTHVIFLDFPNSQAQRERIIKRQPNITPEQLDERLSRSAQERAWASEQSREPNFNIVVNDKLGNCVNDIIGILEL